MALNRFICTALILAFMFVTVSVWYLTREFGASSSIRACLTPRDALPSFRSDTDAAKPKTIWTYWAEEAIPIDVRELISAWRIISPEYTVHVLTAGNVKRFTAEDFSYVKRSSLMSHLIRLAVLKQHGGVWMDATTVLLEPLAMVVTAGFQGVYSPQLSNPGEKDALEIWFLSASKGDEIISMWLELLKMVIWHNRGEFRPENNSADLGIYNDPTVLQTFARAFMNNSGTWDFWSHSLDIHACFTRLYHVSTRFRTLVHHAKLMSSAEVGYRLHHALEWNMSRINDILLSPDDTGFHQLRIHGSKMFVISNNHLTHLKAFLAPSCLDKIMRISTLEEYCPHVSKLPGCSPTYMNSLIRQTTNCLGVSRQYFRLVLARYDEDFSWTDYYRGLRVLYNKGSSLSVIEAEALKSDEHHDVPNVGLETETFLRYIIENYDFLPTFVGFSQASLSPEFGYIRPEDFGPRMFQNMLKEAERDGYSKPLHADPTILGGDWSWDFKAETYKNITLSRRSDSATTLGAWFAEHGWMIRNPNALRLYPTSSFVVHSSHILSRSLEFYKKLHSLVAYASKPAEAHFMERSWFVLFNLDALDGNL
eukprot:351314-Chlamydomonas_euryale.AAC.2